MKVLNDLFDYNYKIYQDSDCFKFSLDSILLAEYVKCKNSDVILDMCTGNAPIPMILYSKNNTVYIDCVEIQSAIYDLAYESINYNNIGKSIKVHHDNVCDYKTSKRYDIITCNPPYFKKDSAIVNKKSDIKAVARHELFITLEDCFSVSKKHLKSSGKFYLVHRPERIDDILKLCNKYKYGISRMCYIYTKENTNSKAVLVEMFNNKKNNIKVYSKNIKGLLSYKNIFEED